MHGWRAGSPARRPSSFCCISNASRPTPDRRPSSLYIPHSADTGEALPSQVMERRGGVFFDSNNHNCWMATLDAKRRSAIINPPVGSGWMASLSPSSPSMNSSALVWGYRVEPNTDYAVDQIHGALDRLQMSSASP